MVKLQLSLAAAFAAFKNANAEKAPGDIIQLKMVSSKQTDQIRILTKPRAGYNPATDTPSVWNLKDGTCEDTSSIDFIFASIDEESKCCKLNSLDGVNLWQEKQGYTIPAGSDIIAQDAFELENGCFEMTKEAEKEREKARKEKEKAEKKESSKKEKVEKESSKKEKAEKESSKKEKVEKESSKKEKAEKESSKKEKVEKESSKKEKAEKESSKKENVEKESSKKEKAEKESSKKEKAEKESSKKEKVEKESSKKEKAEKESSKKEKAEKESSKKEKVEKESSKKENNKNKKSRRLGSSNKSNGSNKKSDGFTLQAGETYNSYMVQALSYDQDKQYFDNLLEFHNQDIVAIIRDTDTLAETDEFFALGSESTYNSVRDDKDRGFEVGGKGYESYYVNCMARPNPGSCPVAAATTAASEIAVTDESCEGRGWGDPHMVTFDGLRYDVHVKGELIFVKSLDSEFEIQGRTEAVENHRSRPAVTTGIVVNEVGDNPRIQVSLARDASGTYTEELRASKCRGDHCDCPVQLFVDGAARPVSSGSGSTKASVEVTDVNNGGKSIVIQYPETKVKVTMDVRNWKQTCHFSVTYTLADCRSDERIVGLVGSPDKEWHNDWMKRDGTPIPIPPVLKKGSGFKPTYDYTQDNWCVYKASDSYFEYEPGTDFAFFDHCDNPYDPSLEEAVANADPATVRKCKGDVFCIIDDIALGPEASDAYLEDPALDHPIAQTATTDIDIVLQVPDESPDPTCPVCEATGWGDPHIITFDGIAYDVHVKGELTFLKSLSTDFTIQARTQIVSNHPKGPAVTTAVVVHEDSALGLPVVQVSLGQDANSELATMIGQCPVQLFVDGEAKDIRLGTGSSDAIVQLKNKRIVVEYPATNLRVDMKVKVWRNTCHFSVTYFLADCRCDETLVGILGQPDGDKYNEWHDHSGTAVDIPSKRRKRRGKEAYDYSRTWCISAGQSHFTYEPGKNHGTFDFCTPDNFDLDIDELIEEASSSTITKCTIDGVLDEGCVVECEFLGPEACTEYVEIVEQTETVEIPSPPTPAPTSGPTSGPTPVPTSGPTLAPVVGPTPPPTPPPTSPPTPPPTSAPTPGPTPPPVAGPPPPPPPPATTPTTTTSRTEISDAGSRGDPHFKTWVGEHFEYHGQCDLVLAKDPNFAESKGLDIQIRTKLVRYWSYIHKAAIRIGKDILEVQGTADMDEKKPHYWFNFVSHGEAHSVGGFPLTITVGICKSRKHRFEIDLSSKYPGQKIVISTMKEFVKVDFVNASAEAFGNTVGMLGDFKTGVTYARDQATVIHDFIQLGSEWQVLPSDDMLFRDVSDPQFPMRCIIPEDPRGERQRRLAESTITAEEAEAACAKTLKNPMDIKDCVYDILATQDMDMVGAF